MKKEILKNRFLNVFSLKEGSDRVVGGFWDGDRVVGGFWDGFGRILGRFGMDLGKIWERIFLFNEH